MKKSIGYVITYTKWAFDEGKRPEKASASFNVSLQTVSVFVYKLIHIYSKKPLQHHR